MLYLCAYLFDGIRGLFKENVCGGGYDWSGCGVMTEMGLMKDEVIEVWQIAIFDLLRTDVEQDAIAAKVWQMTPVAPVFINFLTRAGRKKEKKYYI